MLQTKVWTSILILLALGLHALPVLSYEGNRQARWPILAWAMYAKAIPPGPIEMKRRRIVGVTSDGEKELITPRLAGVSRTALLTQYLKPMWLGDSAAAQRLLSRVNRDRQDLFVEIRIEGEKYSLVGDSVLREEFPATIYKLNPSDSR
jgi:hypothetical protein